MNKLENSNGLNSSGKLPVLICGFFIVIIIWFLAFLPLLPTNRIGWLVEAGTGAAAFFWIWACVEILVWLNRPRPNKWIYKAIGIPVAFSFGGGIFAAAYYFREFLSHHFAYNFLL